MRSAILLTFLALGAAFGSPAIAAGDDGRIRLLEQRLEQSLRMIEALSRRVAELEGRPPAPLAPPPAAPATTARLETLEQQVEELATGRADAAEGLPLHGFADATAGASGRHGAEGDRGNKGFAVGSLDLYLTPSLGGKVRSLVELVFEASQDGDTAADPERVQIGYAFNDALTLWAGRFHTPHGYWNNAFHHGAQLQPTILRPRFLEFEDAGGILPAHGVGLWATGRLGRGDRTVAYDAYLANGTSIDAAGELTVDTTGSGDFHPMSGFSLAWVPESREGLRIGIHGARGRVDIAGEDAVRTRMIGAFAALESGPWAIFAEGYHFADRSVAGDRRRRESNAGYLQASYQLNGLTPFARVEAADLDPRDRYFAAQTEGRSYRRLALGLRYDLDPRAALKLEYDRTIDRNHQGPDDRYHEARVQYAIRF